MIEDLSNYIYKHRLYSESRGRIRIAIMVAVIVAVILNIILVKNLFSKVIVEHENKEIYNSAVKLYETSFDKADLQGMENAYQQFAFLGDYKDAIFYTNKVKDDEEKIMGYNNGIIYFEDNRYKDAFDSFSDVRGLWDTDTYIVTMTELLYESASLDIDNHNYQDAKTKLGIIPEYSDGYKKVQELYALIDGYEEEYNNSIIYADAVSLYESGEYIKAQGKFLDIPEYSDSYAYLENIGSNLYAAAQSEYATRNYGGCVDIIGYIDTSKEWSGHKNAIELRDTVKAEYKAEITIVASEKLRSECYAAMKEYVSECVNAAFTSSDATSLINEYKPIALSTLTPYEENAWQSAPYIASIGFSNQELYFEDGVRDCDGNTYSNVMLGGGYYSSYYLGGKYSFLTGTMFVLEGCQATTDKPVLLAVFNGDGEQMFYEEVLSGYGPKSFSIDVSGVEQISVYFDGFTGDFVWGNDVYGGVGDFSLIP